MVTAHPALAVTVPEGVASRASADAARPARHTPTGVVVVTDRRQALRPLVDVVAAAVSAGARAVLLREKDLPRGQRLRIAVALRELLRPVGGLLIVAGQDTLDGEALHLRAGAVAPLGRPHLLGRSCHDAAELAALSTEDYVTLSPVFTSRSKPGYGPALAPIGLRRLCPRAGRPVLALGGIERSEQAAACRESGASGVAVMGAVMRAEDPAEAYARLRAGWDGVCDGRSRGTGTVIA
ncbi:thiamine phosphate synthase [Catellatospora bangladeshensis]|uniref:Putative thiamine-phosphate synthase n=1 Tax=Catellatospora bangladeshensis TaxID=310355 RepID=A0A8J3JET7_9ACTN|nr:thiamine phosphate synthase [Catellatospora bangladeshensis]GIF79336.1 putative thiamine-phosphate synthase [Catellatospora bangladeshensis]